MKKASFLTAFILSLFLIGLSFSQFGCNQPGEQKPDSAAAPKKLSQAEMISRGQSLVTIGGCNDCHSPKIMTPMGPNIDSSKYLSGHPAAGLLPPIDKRALTPGYWVLVGPDATSFLGPWGISFTANLTPDTATGIGAWTDDDFLKALRTGKHLGQDGGRPILPLMPWVGIGKSTDDDLKSIFAYLKALAPVSNKVPAPIAPPDVAKMK